MTLYEQYSKLYNKAKKYNKEKELPGMITDKFDKQGFRTMFDVVKVSLQEEGKKASVGDVIKEIVSRQQFSASKEEAKVLVKAMEARGYTVTLEEARAFKGYFREGHEEDYARLTMAQRRMAENIENFYNEIAFAYSKLRLEGKSSSEAKKIISNIYFGSE